MFLNASKERLRTLWSKSTLIFNVVGVCWRPCFWWLETSPSSLPSKSTKDPLIKSRFCSPQSSKIILFKGSYESHPGVLTIISYWRLGSGSTLWARILSPHQSKKATPPVRPSIPYVPPTDLLEKRETQQIKVELLNGTRVQMPTYGSGNNEEYLIHVVGTLDDGCVCNVPLPRAPQIQIASHVTCYGADTVTEPGTNTDTCYSQVTRVPMWGNIMMRSLAGLDKCVCARIIPFSSGWLM